MLILERVFQTTSLPELPLELDGDGRMWRSEKRKELLLLRRRKELNEPNKSVKYQKLVNPREMNQERKSASLLPISALKSAKIFGAVTHWFETLTFEY